MKKIISLFFILTALLFSKPKVETGADILLSQKLSLIEGKSIGIVTNHTGLLSNGVHIADTLYKIKSIKINALFGPEHGIRGDAPDGIKIDNNIDAKTGIKVYSLYGKINKPTPEMLKGIDVLIFDIQDIGARYYTFISTLYKIVECCAENKTPLIVLDRPNPISGEYVAGPILEPKFKSFVGITEMPAAHGMTVGELALFFNEKVSADKKIEKAKIEIIKAKNWNRKMYFDNTGLKFTKPSPNIVNVDAELVYPGMCLFEGTNISEGRGTLKPFLQFGAPYINSDKLLSELQSLKIVGVKFQQIEYIPKEIPNMASKPKYAGEKCHGLSITITDRNKFNSVETAVKIIYTIHKLYPKEFSFKENGINRLWGGTGLLDSINSNKTPDEILNPLKKGIEEFKKERKKYLLY